MCETSVIKLTKENMQEVFGDLIARTIPSDSQVALVSFPLPQTNGERGK